LQPLQAAIRSLAFKWIRIIYSCWKQRIAYGEAQYIQALWARRSPLVQRLALSAPA
jgi:hypothetical protein